MYNPGSGSKLSQNPNAGSKFNVLFYLQHWFKLRQISGCTMYLDSQHCFFLYLDFSRRKSISNHFFLHCWFWSGQQQWIKPCQRCKRLKNICFAGGVRAWNSPIIRKWWPLNTSTEGKIFTLNTIFTENDICHHRQCYITESAGSVSFSYIRIQNLGLFKELRKQLKIFAKSLTIRSIHFCYKFT